MRATEFILELYQTVQTLKALGKNTFVFKTPKTPETPDGMVYTISLKREFDMEHKSKLVISFTTPDPASGKPTNGRTNTGNAISIFGTVLSTLLEYLKSLPQDQLPDMLEFSADPNDIQRVRLYNRIAHSNKIPGYEFKSQEPFGYGGRVDFTMKRRVTLAESDRESAVKLIKYLQQNGIKSTVDLKNSLVDKWDVLIAAKNKKIAESLDAPYPLRWNNNGSYDSAVFKLANGRSGSVTFQTKNENAPVHVAFTVDNTAEVSGGGDEQRIFATAIHAIREWLSQNSPLLIEFTAKPANRFRLYQTMVRRYANSFGYQQIPSNKPNTFTLVKKTTMAPGQPTPPPLTELEENFADGRNPEDRGDSARHDIPKKASLNTLDKIVHSKSAGPRKKQLAHWQANMRRGRAK